MKLREDVNYRDFFSAVKKCEEDVYYYNGEGDCLNLKSALAVFAFSMIAVKKRRAEGEIRCQSAEDEMRLAGYLDRH